MTTDRGEEPRSVTLTVEDVTDKLGANIKSYGESKEKVQELLTFLNCNNIP